MHYLKVTEQKAKVPGQTFLKGETPKEVCSKLISQNAADWDGPYQINFRYDRSSKGVWDGTYSIETSAQHRDIVAGRAEYDKAIAVALGAEWDSGVQARRVTYGSIGTDPGPKLIVRGKSGSDRTDVHGPLREAWDAMVKYLRAQGVRHLYYVDYTMTKPTARLREGDNMQVIYSV